MLRTACLAPSHSAWQPPCARRHPTGPAAGKRPQGVRSAGGLCTCGDCTACLPPSPLPACLLQLIPPGLEGRLRQASHGLHLQAGRLRQVGARLAAAGRPGLWTWGRPEGADMPLAACRTRLNDGSTKHDVASARLRGSCGAPGTGRGILPRGGGWGHTLAVPASTSSAPGPRENWLQQPPPRASQAQQQNWRTEEGRPYGPGRPVLRCQSSFFACFATSFFLPPLPRTRI